MFGIYLVDAFGNKELLYRDLHQCSLWPMLLQGRPSAPPVAAVARPGDIAALPEAAVLEANGGDGRSDNQGSIRRQAADFYAAGGKLPEVAGPNGVGLVFVQNVTFAWPELPPVAIRRLRIVQVLPKATPHINTPPLGLANASPGKQVLGTVPVEADGSAFFWAPAGIPLAFQALDELGQAVQIMRSVTYLQPGEVSSCIGCHEPRHWAPPPGRMPLALLRGPSLIEPGPSGSRPLSYPLLVQPILDRHCVRCHNDRQAEGGINLLGTAEGKFTTSYLALAARVRFSAWTGAGNFLETNCEPYTRPDFFGARGSPLMKLLLSEHAGVKLSREEIEALATWMDTNALFYGTFDPEDQQRQLRGQAIAGPSWQ
jgi:mono/diheme cytochrome c family protein